MNTDVNLDDNIKVIFFDLDGTLNLMNVNSFIMHYMKCISASVAHLVSPKSVIKNLLTAKNAVELNNGEEPNIEVYARAFFPLEGHYREEIEPIFDIFHEKEFPKLQKLAQKKPGARAVVQKAFDKGYEVVIATTPLLPKTAVRQRLEWAEIADFPYKLITTIENSKATKPNLTYYKLICKEINRPAEACLMVGDEEKDMVAANIGCQTFLINSANTKIDDSVPEPTYIGTLADLEIML
jgi:HAD superfamily hydrolase (TIGR01549 family)